MNEVNFTGFAAPIHISKRSSSGKGSIYLQYMDKKDTPGAPNLILGTTEIIKQACHRQRV
jgi:hypothetical protein